MKHLMGSFKVLLHSWLHRYVLCYSFTVVEPSCKHNPPFHFQSFAVPLRINSLYSLLQGLGTACVCRRV
ncbi:hypothetical protein XENTR_v10011096 [Xenopus tropicalis]|nr:hypothetical protein XENTR_v10011096 [Xenopus tropicalis]